MLRNLGNFIKCLNLKYRLNCHLLKVSICTVQSLWGRWARHLFILLHLVSPTHHSHFTGWWQRCMHDQSCIKCQNTSQQGWSMKSGVWTPLRSTWRIHGVINLPPRMSHLTHIQSMGDTCRMFSLLQNNQMLYLHSTVWRYTALKVGYALSLCDTVILTLCKDEEHFFNSIFSKRCRYYL